MDCVVSAQLVALGKIAGRANERCGYRDHVDLSPQLFELALGRAERASSETGVSMGRGEHGPCFCVPDLGAHQVVAIREPDAVRAVVNDAGYDTFNPQAPVFTMGRMMFGGSPEATEADPDAAERAFRGEPQMAAVFERMKADYDSAQGEGHWRRYLHLFFDRITRFPGYTFDDFRSITAPTLILAGDRDHFCSVEEAAVAYRKLPAGELAILPDTGHLITPAAVAATVDFLLRHAGN